MKDHKHYEAARRAYYWTSFNPEKRAESECAFYDSIMTEFSDSPQVQEKFERLFMLSLAAKSRCMSSMITGPARFPVAKAERANEREHKISGEMLAYIERVRKAKAQEAYYEAHPEARPVMAGDADALERLRDKLARLEKLQETMKEANKLVRKGDRDALVGLMQSEQEADTLLSKRGYWGKGFAPFELVNNNVRIKVTRDRIAELEKRKATEGKDITVNGVRILENTEAMRLQIFFNGKPEREMIELLRRHGFKWAPSNMAWQRQLTSNAINAFNKIILPAIKQIAAAA